MTTRTCFIILYVLVYTVQGTDYLIALHNKKVDIEIPVIHYQVDETGGTIHFTSPYYDLNTHEKLQLRSSGQFVVDELLWTIREVEYKGILVTSTNSHARISVRSQYSSFAPLPTSALGTKYIVSSCYQYPFNSLLVIAAYNSMASVSIITRSPIFRHRVNPENKRTLELKPFQTFTFEHSSDLTGTVIASTQPIAVFSGMSNSTFVTAYEQLLPVRLYDKEYVVAVDDNPSLYHLQILSEQNKTGISFNNGSFLTVDSQLYQAQLKSEDRFYFMSSDPVMVTICRHNGTQAGFIVIPPVSLYSKGVANITPESIVITKKETFINSSDITWTHLPNSIYKTGRLTEGSITRNVNGCNIVIHQDDIRTNGIAFREPSPIEVKKSYLVALSTWIKNNVYFQIGFSKGVSYQVLFPQRNLSYIRQMKASPSDTFNIDEGMKVLGGVENKAIRVDVDSEGIQLSIEESVLYAHESGIWISSVFPTAILGKEYIVQTCYGNIASETQLIIASSSVYTEINVLLSHSITYDGVEYKPGDTIQEGLQPYQTLTITSSVALCGTFVSASHNVAVFTLSSFGNVTTNYNQLLPVNQFGKEYITVSSDQRDHDYFSRFISTVTFSSQYYVLVTSANDLTQVTFGDNLQVTVEERISYRKNLLKNQTLHLSSSKPVMLSLCRDATAIVDTVQFHQSCCVIIPPLRLYTSKSWLSFTSSTKIKIVSESTAVEITLLTSGVPSPDNTVYWNDSVDITWEIHNNFKIGTAIVLSGQIYISSNKKFTTIAFNQDVYFLSLYSNFAWNMMNPLGWNHEPVNVEEHTTGTTGIHFSEFGGRNGEITTITGRNITSGISYVSVKDTGVNTVAVATGTTLSVIIIILLAVLIWQQIDKKRQRNSDQKGEKTEGRAEESEESFSQNQRQRQEVAADSASDALHSELCTEHQYESINQSLSMDSNDDYERVESKF